MFSSLRKLKNKKSKKCWLKKQKLKKPKKRLLIKSMRQLYFKNNKTAINRKIFNSKMKSYLLKRRNSIKNN